MKKLILSITLACSFIGASKAQTNLWDFLTTGSNYWAAPFSTYSVKDHSFGGGIAVGYLASQVINPIVRFDYFAGQAWMVSGNVQLQPPRQLMGKIPVIPFALAGVGTPIGGAGELNGTAIGIVGVGAAVKFDGLVSTNSFFRRMDLVADYEHWSGMPEKQQNQVRVGLLFKF